MKRFLLLVMLGVFPTFIPPAAFADAPLPIGSHQQVEYAAGDVCSFPVSVRNVTDQSLLHTLGDNTVFITGHLVQKVTNLTTGQATTVNASGSLRITFDENGADLVGHGPILYTFFELDVGGPGLFLLTGEQVFHNNAAGHTTAFAFSGTKQDICTRLA